MCVPQLGFTWSWRPFLTEFSVSPSLLMSLTLTRNVQQRAKWSCSNQYTVGAFCCCFVLFLTFIYCVCVCVVRITCGQFSPSLGSSPGPHASHQVSLPTEPSPRPKLLFSFCLSTLFSASQTRLFLDPVDSLPTELTNWHVCHSAASSRPWGSFRCLSLAPGLLCGPPCWWYWPHLFSQ